MKRLVSFLKKHTIAVIMAIALSLPSFAWAFSGFYHVRQIYDAKRDILTIGVFDLVTDEMWGVCYVQGNHCMVLCGDDCIEYYF